MNTNAKKQNFPTHVNQCSLFDVDIFNGIYAFMTISDDFSENDTQKIKNNDTKLNY